MKLTITESNFSTNHDWLFKLKDTDNDVFYILSADQYRRIELRSPITRNQLHYYYLGSEIEAEVIEFDNRNIVTGVLEYA